MALDWNFSIGHYIMIKDVHGNVYRLKDRLDGYAVATPTPAGGIAANELLGWSIKENWLAEAVSLWRKPRRMTLSTICF